MRIPYRPSRSFVWCLIPLLLLGGAGAFAWHRANSVPINLRANLAFLDALKFKITLATNPPTDEDIAMVRKEALALKAKLVAEFPALKITPQPVPDADNGFLLLHQLATKGHPALRRLPLSKDFQQVLHEQGLAEDTAPWDPEHAKRCLTEHAELVERIEHIAALATRSSSNMPADWDGLVGAHAGKCGSEILLLKARLAAEARDESETLRLIAAAGNLVSHYHNVEAPSLYSKTVAILIDLGINGSAFKTLLPAFGRNANLSRWQAALGNRSYSPTEFATVMRGEWNVSADSFALPVFLAAAKNHQLRDAEAVARTYTAWFNTCVTKLPSLGLTDMTTALSPPADVSHLSKEGREILDHLDEGFLSWTKGYVRAAAVSAQYRAALELLILEKSGTPLTASATGQITRDPVSGAPFLLDPDKRSLAAPPDTAALGIEPLPLPW